MTVLPPPPTVEDAVALAPLPWHPVGWVRGLSVGVLAWGLLSARALSRFSEDREAWNSADSGRRFVSPLGTEGTVTSIEGTVTIGTSPSASLEPFGPAVLLALVLIPTLVLLAKTDRPREVRMAVVLCAASLGAIAIGVGLHWSAGALFGLALIIGYATPLVLLGATRGTKGALLLLAAGIIGPYCGALAADVLFVTGTAVLPPYTFPFLMLPVVVLPVALLGRFRPANWFVRAA